MNNCKDCKHFGLFERLTFASEVCQDAGVYSKNMPEDDLENIETGRNFGCVHFENI